MISSFDLLKLFMVIVVGLGIRVLHFLIVRWLESRSRRSTEKAKRNPGLYNPDLPSDPADLILSADVIKKLKRDPNENTISEDDW